MTNYIRASVVKEAVVLALCGREVTVGAAKPVVLSEPGPWPVVLESDAAAGKRQWLSQRIERE